MTRLDPTSAKVVANIEAGVLGEGGDITADGGWVRARGTHRLVTRIDPRKNEVAANYGPSSGSRGAIVGYGAVWVSAHDITTVWRPSVPKP